MVVALMATSCSLTTDALEDTPKFLHLGVSSAIRALMYHGTEIS